MPKKIDDVIGEVIEPGVNRMGILEKALKKGFLYSKQEVMDILGISSIYDRPHRILRGVSAEERSKWVVRIRNEVFFARPETIEEYRNKRRSLG